MFAIVGPTLILNLKGPKLVISLWIYIGPNNYLR